MGVLPILQECPSSRCFTTVAHIFPSLLSRLSFCSAKQWWLLQSAISDRMPAALFPSVSAAATGGKSSHLLNGRFCQLSHYCSTATGLSRVVVTAVPLDATQWQILCHPHSQMRDCHQGGDIVFLIFFHPRISYIY